MSLKKLKLNLKLLIFCFVFFVLANSALAEDIGINLIEYHPDTYYTRLQISNNAGRDLNDIEIKIGDSFTTKSSGLFKNGAMYNAILNIPPGEHQVTVTTREGVSSSKVVYFSLSKQNVKEEISRQQEETRKEQDLKQIAQKNLEAAQKQLDVERQKAVELGILKEDKFSMNVVLIGIIVALIIGAIIIYWFIRGSKK